MQSHINLLPTQYRPKLQVRAWPIFLAIALMLNLIIISTYWLTLQLNLNRINSDIQSLESEVSSLERQVEEAQWREEFQAAVKVKADFIDIRMAGWRPWKPAVDAIENAMVRGLHIEGMSFSNSGDISISGVTDSVATAADFWGSLQQETGLDIVRMSYIEPSEEFQAVLRGWTAEQLEDLAEEEEQAEEEDDDE